MMKYWSLIFMVIVLSGVSGQTVDSLAIRQVDSLIQVSRTLTTQKEFVKALEVNASAEQIAFTKLGRESLSYSNVSFNRGRINEFKSDYKEAEKGYLESKNIIEKLLGKEHLDYAWSLNNIAAMYNDMGNNDKAEPLYLEALAIRGKALGKEHLDYAISLSNLGTMYVDMGIYEKAEQYFLEAKAIREKVLGKEHPDYAKSLNKLATFYGRTGKYEQAEPLFIEATAIVEKSLGKEHPDYASSLGNLAILYKIMGNYGKAELLYLETKDIWEKLIGKEHPDYAKSLGNLAILYKLMGNYEKAELLYLEAIVIWEKVFGKEHPDYASNLSNLALLYSVMGRYEKAEQLFLETKSITEKAFGKEHPQYAHILNSLGNMFMKIDKFEKAEPLFNEALATQEKIFGKEHPTYAHTLHNLAILNKTRGNYKKAEQLYIESKAIYVTTLGKEHPSYSQCLKNMALFYENQNNYRDSELLLDEYFMLTKTSLIRSTTFLSEQELAKFEGTYQTMGDQLSSFLFARQSKFGQQSILPELIFDHSLFQKGFLLSAATRVHFPETTSPETAEINLRLIGFRRRLAAEYSKPIAKRKGITELEGNANLAEKELARSVDGYADAIRQVKWQDVKAVLQQSEAAIEFIHFKVNFPFSTDSTMYAAILVLPGAEQPKFIPLFEERVLGHLVQSNTERKADYVNELYSLSDRGLVKLGSERQSLYDLVWRPLDSDLAGIKTIYFSPSGLLHRINMDAIPLSEAETIADKYQLIALNSTRQIVIPTPLDNTNNDAVLFGGIQFEHDSTNLNNEPLLASRSRGDLSFTSVDFTLRGGSWNYLAGTEREVKAIEKIMQISGINTKLRKGYEATEESFKNIGANNAASPRILHIATHGYFFPDPKSNTAGTGLGGEQETVFKISDHPMLRSGLILAGGNAAWQGNQTLEGREDGILTAYEISQMNLSNTELVVLSACETGLGEIQGNEGVYGLQRAFKIAGAKYLIMSLWQVPDKQTSLLMTTFYKKWLELKMSIPEAFHSAQKELRDIGLDPYQWAGFVLVE